MFRFDRGKTHARGWHNIVQSVFFYGISVDSIFHEGIASVIEDLIILVVDKIVSVAFKFQENLNTLV